VLLAEVLKSFEGAELKIFVDGTLGAGGHGEALLKAHPEIELYIGIDQDALALKIARKRLLPFAKKIKLIEGNYLEADEFIRPLKADGVLLDLGVSSMQLEEKERGFSFLKEGLLDMRMDQKKPLTAEKVVNEFSEIRLGEIFKLYGEEKHWRRAARAIILARKKGRIKTTRELAAILQAEGVGKKKLHPATLVFQALRIFVNDELKVLEKGLKRISGVLGAKGRLAVISFHSLEDRIVKEFFKKITRPEVPEDYREKKILPAFRLIYKKPLQALREELRDNPRSRSAKLRAVEKIK
jgi:16S rRNA (cytosine1402-N4)-methyltransferase